jgi:hypothetical protein
MKNISALIIAVVIGVLMACGGLYGAWMYYMPLATVASTSGGSTVSVTAAAPSPDLLLQISSHFSVAGLGDKASCAFHVSKGVLTWYSSDYMTVGKSVAKSFFELDIPS